MILELNDIEIILRKASDEEKQSIPVWDAYIEKVIIDGNIPSLLRDKLTGKINNLTQGFTLTLGIMGEVLCLLQKRSSNLFKIIGEVFILGIIFILVLTLTIIIIPYA